MHDEVTHAKAVAAHAHEPNTALKEKLEADMAAADQRRRLSDAQRTQKLAEHSKHVQQVDEKHKHPDTSALKASLDKDMEVHTARLHVLLVSNAII